MMYVPGNLSGWSTVREEFPGLLCEVGHGEVSPHAQGQHTGGRLRERLVRWHSGSIGAWHHSHPRNGLEFNMESGREAAKTRSHGKFPEPQILPQYI